MRRKNMGKLKSYMMDIEEDVYAIEGLEEKIFESEDISEAYDFVVSSLDLKTSFDIGIAKDVVRDLWNEGWSYYQ
tara:strand:+ start:1439 stop:1663 length:225 start_codon:yes stop_codon:yes gene_type:complete